MLATKVGMDMGEAGKGLSAAHIERACEASLRRLGTDRIDLYQSHLDDADVPLEETLTAHDRLVRAGKVRAIGASNYTAARLSEALAVSQAKDLPRYECLQPEYSLAARGYEAELEPLCRSEEIGVIGYFSLAAGFLTGKYREAGAAAGRARENRVAPYLNTEGLRAPRRARRGGCGAGGEPGPGGTRLDHRPAGHHGAHRQRDHGGATRRVARGHPHHPPAGRHRAARRGERGWDRRRGLNFFSSAPSFRASLLGRGTTNCGRPLLPVADAAAGACMTPPCGAISACIGSTKPLY